MEMLEKRNFLKCFDDKEQAKNATHLICHTYFPELRQVYHFLKKLSV